MGKNDNKNFLLYFVIVFCCSCAPRVSLPGKAIFEVKILENFFSMPDGTELPLKKWLPKGRDPTAIILGIHGFNDYSNAFLETGVFLAKNYGVALFAYDQRGFGGAEPRGAWAGLDAYIEDAKVIILALKKLYPNLPIFILGESMGGAIAVVVMGSSSPSRVNGTILMAPAVWGRKTMPWYQRGALSLGAHLMPWMTLSGKGLNLKPSDNLEMLKRLSKDPLIIKETRIGTVYGLTNLMDLAADIASDLTGPTLILYGERDEIIPKKPVLLMVKKLFSKTRVNQRIALYENGYHMLSRDLHSSIVLNDIGSWIVNGNKPLPSRADQRNILFLLNK